jgi:hypothetical protein
MRAVLAIALALGALSCGKAPAAAGPLAIDQARPRSPAPIVITSPAIGRDGAIPARFSANGANRSPPLTWTPAPGARSYALILEDPDAPSPHPWSHWLIWNISPAAHALPEGLALGGRLPSGAVQGKGDAGSVGYFGPRPPSGVHHYHFQIFALDGNLALAPGSSREALVGAMRGHVLAAGQMVATFQAPHP